MKHQTHNPSNLNLDRFLALFVLLLAMVTPTGLRADEGKLYTAEKMSSSTIACVTQDSYGFIWVGTEYGLNRFDGYQFVKYFTDMHDSTSLVSNEVTAFLLDRHQQLWVGCRKGIARYDHATDAFHRYQFPDGVEPRVVSMVEDAKGNIFVGTSGYGLYVIEAGKQGVDSAVALRQAYTNDFIGSVFIDDRGDLWCTSLGSKLTRISVNGLQPTATKDFDTGCGPVVRFLRQDQRGFFVVCMYGILYYDYLRSYLLPANYNIDLLAHNVSIRDACFDHAGNLYVGTSGMGLMVVPRDSRTLQQVDNADPTFSLSTANVNNIFEDRSQNLWVGCNKKGLYQLRHTQGAFATWRFSKQNYVLGSSISSIAAATGGDVLCVVQKSGIYRFAPDGRIRGKMQSPEAPTVVYKDRHNNYWLGTESALYQYDPATERSTLRLRVDGWGVSCISDDGNGHLFISNDGRGLCIYDIATGEKRTFSMNDQDEKNGSLVNNWIRALYYDSRGLLWIGSVDGLGCMDPNGDNFRVLGWDIQFKGYKCYSLHEMSDGNMLIGTEAGLYTYDRQTGQFSLFPGSEEMQNKSINSIVADQTGDLWLSTVNGIWHYDPKRRQFESYVYGDGLEVHEYIVGAKILQPDGRILFGNNDGITAFYPHEVKGSSSQAGQVYLTTFMVGGQRLDCQQQRFVLSHAENSFSMEFSMLDFSKTDNTTFLYRINQQGDWQTIPEGTHTLSFNKMKPGDYHIEVRAMSNGHYVEAPCRLTVSIRPPWYQTWWAYLAYALLFSSLLAIGIYYYNHWRKKQLEEAKMRFLINATHDIRSPLTLILGPLKKLQQKVDDMQPTAALNANDCSEMQHYLGVIDRNAQRLLLLVNQILDERRIDKDQLHLHCRETDLVKFIENIYALYLYHARQRNISFIFDHEAASVNAWIDHTHFDKVLSNLLSNAFKYTFDGGEVRIVLTNSDTTATIQVIDNGIGFKNERIDKLFERFYQGDNSRNIQSEGSGIGLNLSRSIVKLHGGSIRAYNRPDGLRGACVEVSLPLGNKHLKPEAIEKIVEREEMSEESDEGEVRGERRQPNRTGRILVVDDDPEIARYIESELGYWYRFDSAPDGREALKLLFNESYDLLITDVMMPRLDGIELLKHVKGTPQLSDIPVVLLTSKTEVAHRMEGIRNGADAYIAKPFTMDELHVQIDNLISNVRRLRGKFSGALNQEDRVQNVEVKGNNDALMARIVKAVNAHYSDPSFNVESLTTEVGISRAQLHRKMKEITGVSTADFIRNIRLQQAERLIRERKVNITQVAYAVGFNNQSHFSTIFRRYYGMTPTEYAAKHAEAEKGAET